MDLRNLVGDLKGVGSKKAEYLKKLNIETVKDLIEYIPRKYEDRRKFTPITDLLPGETYYIKGDLFKVTSYRGRGRKSPIILKIRDATGVIDIVYFNSTYLRTFFQTGQSYAFYGRVAQNGSKIQMVQPEYCKVTDAEQAIIPIYGLTKGLSQRDMRKFQKAAQSATEQFDEWLPQTVVETNKLCDIPYAYRNIHFPKDEKAYKQSKYRIVFDELFAFQVGLSAIKNYKLNTSQGIRLIKDDTENIFIDNLGFEFTKGQQKVWKQIKTDLENDMAMNRLIQGDVGSGKTAIAETAMFKTVKNGYQAVMMAPTEILAKQHLATLQDDLASYGINVGLLCSSMKQSDKKYVLEELSNGNIDILVGTHAIIQENVEFKKLGLVVTDEQHRFGVMQRNLLETKGKGVNIMVMTATPIPRTLAVVLYSDLDISIIDTMPKGRLPIITEGYKTSQRKTVYAKVEDELLKGHQCYVVAPLIEESETLEVDSVEEVYKYLLKLFPHRSVAYLYGTLNQDEKDRIMDDFASGKIDILVSTVVIEVGINVPNATIMVIENCERFGLAQLHQLRGRVGRGNEQSYCFLITRNESKISRQRMEVMQTTNDGMQIAEEDLKLRGPGDFFGTKQHGLPELKYANLIDHIQMLNHIKLQVEDILRSDPELKNDENKNIKKEMNELFARYCLEKDNLIVL